MAGRPRATRPGLPAVHNGQERVWWRGKWHHLGPAGSQEARREYARLVELWSVNPDASARRPDDLLVAELFADYLSHNPEARTRSSGRDLRAISLFLQLYDGSACNEVQGPEFHAWISWLAAKRVGDRSKYTQTYIIQLMAAIRSVWRWGVATGRVPYDWLAAIETVQAPRPGRVRPGLPRPSADSAAIAATLPHLHPRWRVLVELQLHTGARPSELMRLRQRDVLRSGVVAIPGAGSMDLDREKVWAILPKHKTAHHRKSRVLFIGAALHERLLPYVSTSPDAMIWPGRWGEQLGAKSYCQAVKRAARKAKVATWTPYQLRHLAAEQVDEAHGAMATMEFLGHSSLGMTERYRKARAAARRGAEIARGRG